MFRGTNLAAVSSQGESTIFCPPGIAKAESAIQSEPFAPCGLGELMGKLTFGSFHPDIRGVVSLITGSLSGLGFLDGGVVILHYHRSLLVHRHRA